MWIKGIIHIKWLAQGLTDCKCPIIILVSKWTVLYELNIAQKGGKLFNSARSLFP